MPERQSDTRNRDDDQKPGSPPRPATENAKGAGGDKTATDPATGEPQDGPPAPNQAKADQTDGVGRK